MSAEGDRPVLRVVRGEPDDDELAAVTAVLVGLLAGPVTAAAAPARSAWSDRAARLGRPPRPGPGAWRRSAMPC